MKINGTNIKMIRGDTEMIRVSVEDSYQDQVLLSEGDTIYFTVKTNARTAVKQIQKIITEFDEGQAFIPIEPSDTKPMRYGKYVYDIQLTKDNGEVRTIVECSNFTIEEEVTYE